MDKKDKLTINNLLTVDQLINLGTSDSKQLFTNFSTEVLKKYACKNNLERKKFDECYKKYILDEFDKLGMPTDLYDYTDKMDKYEDINFNLLIKEDKDGKYYASYSKHDFFESVVSDNLSFLQDYYGERKVYAMRTAFLKDISTKNGEEFKIAVLEMLKEIKNAYTRYIDKTSLTLASGNGFFINRDLKSQMNNEDALNIYRKARKVIHWFIKNIDTVLEFLDGKYPNEVIETLDKDRFILLQSMSIDKDTVQSLVNASFDSKELTDINQENIEEAVNYMNNYLLLVDYINRETNNSYTEYSVFEDDVLGMVTIDPTFIASCVKHICDDYIEESSLKYNDPDTLLKDVAYDTWRKRKNKKIAKSITLKFDMVRSGTIDAYRFDKMGPRNIGDEGVRKARIEKDYELLAEKMDYYKSKNPVLTLHGVSNLEGYFAMFFENGCVILDKYYSYGKDRKGKSKIVPAHCESIYNMNYEGVFDLASCDKQELMEEVRNNNPDIHRVYHSANWKSRLDKIIEGSGYGGLDYDLLDDIVEEFKNKSI